MISKLYSASLLGIDAYPIEVEVDLAKGLPFFSTVGLPDAAVKESRERVKSALNNTGYRFPNKRITINLAPADIRKEGTGFDLPICLGILAAQGIIENNCLNKFIIIGEISLTGQIRPIRGALSLALIAKKLGRDILLPKNNANEAAIVQGINVYPLENLTQAVDFINGKFHISSHEVDFLKIGSKKNLSSFNFSDVKGQESAKRALEVACAGKHNILLIGPPGAGKSMLAKRIPTILPPLNFEECIETTRIYSTIGLIDPQEIIMISPPFRSPHHSITAAAMIGGGPIPKPGEVSLAHNGVLFLDEFAEFKKNVLEVMRQPIEDGHVTISRANLSVRFPSQFMLAAAMNPCPCGYFSHPQKECQCTHYQIKSYLSKISGPLLDRIDIHIELPPLTYKELTSDNKSGVTSETIRERVISARQIQRERYKDIKVFSNMALPPKKIREFCPLNQKVHALLERAINYLGLSARAYDKILRVARTIADLEASDQIHSDHISEAIGYRSLDRDYWGI